jgi:hypothetical protein
VTSAELEQVCERVGVEVRGGWDYAASRDRRNRRRRPTDLAAACLEEGATPFCSPRPRAGAPVNPLAIFRSRL